jgi:putative tryptophan/tyrosine transport system substrate-binding protein
MKRRDFVTLVGGAALGWSLAARAQQAEKVARVGVLWRAANAEQEGSTFKSLVKGFSDLGYVEGQNLKLEHRFPNIDAPERFKSAAAELASSNVDVLMGVGSNAANLAKNTTTTIPVVFLLVADPVGSKLVDNPAQPGGNVTGLASYSPELFTKRLELLKELIPGLARLGLLINMNDQLPRPFTEATQVAAEHGLALQTFDWKTTGDLGPAFDRMKQTSMQAFTTNPDGMSFAHRTLIAQIAAARSLPFSSWSRDTLKLGAIMSYATDQDTICEHAAIYADKILKGAKPGELPVEEPKKFELFINPKSAKALGVTIPEELLKGADGVVD